MDYIVGKEDRIANVLDSYDFDYVVGSVHFVRNGAVDDDVYDIWDSVSDPDHVWKLYFDTLAEAMSTGLYDIAAHPDLVKLWGDARPAPTRDPRFYNESAVEAIAETGTALEFTTAGWRKPVGEQYPSQAFAEMCIDAGAVFALSSDAHTPEQVGFEYERAVKTLTDWGVTELAVFEGRSRRTEPLG
jgi:histidinol-phosphatase (PHP family)